MTKSVFTKEYKLMLELLIKARKEAGLSQRDLSAKLQRPSSFVGKYETGERRLDVVEMLQITKILNIDACNIIRKLEVLI